MAWCEAAQKDCPYLQDALDLRDSYTLVRATGTPEEQAAASRAENPMTKLIENESAGCEEDHCHLLGMAVRYAVGHQVIDAME